MNLSLLGSQGNYVGTNIEKWDHKFIYGNGYRPISIYIHVDICMINTNIGMGVSGIHVVES